MYIIFSPSKSQSPVVDVGYKHAKPFFEKKSQIINERIKQIPRKDLREMYRVSDDLFEKIIKQVTDPKKYSAIALFSGTAYKQLSLDMYRKKDKEYLQKYLRILSARYGVLTPYDEINQYRLDMNDRVFKDHSLYDFWKEGIVRYFKDTDVIINLASNEYAKLLSATYSSNMVTISFLVEKKGGLKSISVVSKQQRGKLLHWMIQNHITEVSDIKKYTQDNFLFDKEKSDTQNYIFIKES